MKKIHATPEARLAARAAQARERRARRRVTADGADDVAVIGNLSPGAVAQLERDKALLLAGLLDRGTPTVAPSIEELVAAVPVDPPDQVAELIAAEAAAADVVAQITYALAQLDIAKRQTAYDAQVAVDAILLGPLAQDNQQRAALVHAQAQVEDAAFEVQRLELLARLGPAETALAAAREAAEPARQAAALKALVASRKVAEEADAQRSADLVGSRLKWIADTADSVLAEAQLAKRDLAQFDKTALPQLAAYEATRRGVTATKGLDLQFARSIQSIRETRALMLRSLAEDPDAITRVRTRVTTTGGRWTEEEQDEVVLAVRRLRTITRDAVASLRQRVTSLATTAMRLVDSDLASAASGDPTSIPRHHHYSDDAAIERAGHRESMESLEYRQAESEARALETKHAAQRAMTQIGTMQFNAGQRQAAQAIQDRVDAARREQEQVNAVNLRTAEIRAAIGR